MKNGLRLIVGVVCLSLFGCGVYSQQRAPEDTFFSVQAAQIPTAKLGLFTDCLMDGLVTVRQFRRTDRTRIEVTDNPASIFLSADIFDDGRVEFFESTYGALVPTRKERAAFAACVKKFESAE